MLITIFFNFVTSLTLNGFDFCFMLDNTHFKENDVTVNEIDTIANEIFQSTQQIMLTNLRTPNLLERQPITRDCAIRYACYLALLELDLDYVVDPNVYFTDIQFIHLPIRQSILPASMDVIHPNSLDSKKKCRIGFLIMVTKYVQNAIRLINALNDLSHSILIQVDSKYPEEYQSILEYVKSHSHLKNIYFNQQRDVQWGHSSMVFTQQDGFFKLSQYFQCEYYINLSDLHYILKSPQEIYTILKNVDKNWFGHTFRDPKIISWFDHSRRLHGPPVLKSAEYSGYPSFPFGIPDSEYYTSIPSQFQPLYKSDQWMILKHDFVEQMQRNPIAIQLLVEMEWICIPDELYYKSLAKMISPESVYERASTFIRWKLFQPDYFKKEDVQVLKTASDEGYLFTRKIGDHQLYDELDDRFKQ